MRRGAALLALLSFFAPLELLLPGAHDKDAVAAQLDGSTVSGPQDDHQSVPVPTPEHRAHVDHCAHAHLLALSLRETVPGARVPPGGLMFDTSTPTLKSVSVQPHQRPPIA